MQLHPTPCPGRSAMHVGDGECSECTRYDHDAPRSAVPPTAYMHSIGEWVCVGRRFHGAQSIVDVAQAAKPRTWGLSAAFVSSAGDAA